MDQNLAKTLGFDKPMHNKTQVALHSSCFKSQQNKSQSQHMRFAVNQAPTHSPQTRMHSSRTLAHTDPTSSRNQSSRTLRSCTQSHFVHPTNPNAQGPEGSVKHFKSTWHGSDTSCFTAAEAVKSLSQHIKQSQSLTTRHKSHCTQATSHNKPSRNQTRMHSSRTHRSYIKSQSINQVASSRIKSQSSHNVTVHNPPRTRIHSCHSRSHHTHTKLHTPSRIAHKLIQSRTLAHTRLHTRLC